MHLSVSKNYHLPEMKFLERYLLGRGFPNTTKHWTKRMTRITPFILYLVLEIKKYNWKLDEIYLFDRNAWRCFKWVYDCMIVHQIWLLDAMEVCWSLFVVALLLVQFESTVVIFLISSGMPLTFLEYLQFISVFFSGIKINMYTMHTKWCNAFTIV